MARLGRTEVRFPEKLKCQTFERKTDLADINHVNQPPPLILPTILVHYYCVLPGKNIENFIMKHNDMIESGYSQGDIEARDIYLTIFPNNMIFLRIY